MPQYTLAVSAGCTRSRSRHLPQRLVLGVSAPPCLERRSLGMITGVVGRTAGPLGLQPLARRPPSGTGRRNPAMQGELLAAAEGFRPLPTPVGLRNDVGCPRDGQACARGLLLGIPRRAGDVWPAAADAAAPNVGRVLTRSCSHPLASCPRLAHPMSSGNSHPHSKQNERGQSQVH